MMAGYEIRHLKDPCDEVGKVEGFCYADGYGIWERQGEGLVLRFHVDFAGRLQVDAEWPKKWDEDKAKKEALEWALEWDVFSTTKDMNDDNAYICKVGEEGV